VLLIGMLDSPFVRRVAITMRVMGLGFEHGNWSIGRDFERIRQYNPLVRVPTLVLDDGEVLCESIAILDYLDDLVGPQRALLPPGSVARRQAQQYIALLLGAADFTRDLIYERQMRPPEKQHAAWSERRERQMHGALALLEQRVAQRVAAQWLLNERLTQADITLACCYSFIADALPLPADAPYPRLQARVARYEQLPDFKATFTPFFVPAPAAAAATE
jgi:glutathione S-transferase